MFFENKQRGKSMSNGLESLVANDMAVANATVDSTTLLIRSLMKAKVLTTEQACSTLIELASHMVKLSHDPKYPGQEPIFKVISERYQSFADDLRKVD